MQQKNVVDFFAKKSLFLECSSDIFLIKMHNIEKMQKT